jgi:uncharacterized protein
MEQVFEAEGIPGTLHTPDRATGHALVLTHGAGSNRNAPLLVRLSRGFADAGCLVLRFDLPFRQQRPNGPPSPAGAARDREGIARAVEAVKRLAPGPIFAGGHSYGGRQTAMAAAEQPGMADALLLLSYPLHPPNRPEQKRTAFFPELRTPGLFVHGSADAFGTIEELREAIELIPAPTELMAVPGAGHDLKRAGDLGAEMLGRLKKGLGT